MAMSEKSSTNLKSVNLTLNEKSVKRHIKRLGKVLQENPDIELKKSFSHTQVQEMFSEILGFNNYNELHEVLKHNAPSAIKAENSTSDALSFDDDSHLLDNMKLPEKHASSWEKLSDDPYRVPEGKISQSMQGMSLAEIEKKTQLYFYLNTATLPHACKWFDFTVPTHDLKKGTGVLLLLLLKMNEKESLKIKQCNLFSHFAIKENREALLGYEVELNDRIVDNTIFSNPVFMEELVQAVKSTQVGEGKEAIYQLNHLLPLMNQYQYKIRHLVQLNQSPIPMTDESNTSIDLNKANPHIRASKLK
jgi:hypothetical protein